MLLNYLWEIDFTLLNNWCLVECTGSFIFGSQDLAVLFSKIMACLLFILRGWKMIKLILISCRFFWDSRSLSVQVLGWIYWWVMKSRWDSYGVFCLTQFTAHLLIYLDGYFEWTKHYISPTRLSLLRYSRFWFFTFGRLTYAAKAFPSQSSCVRREW